MFGLLFFLRWALVAVSVAACWRLWTPSRRAFSSHPLSADMIWAVVFGLVASHVLFVLQGLWFNVTPDTPIEVALRCAEYTISIAINLAIQPARSWHPDRDA